MAGRKCGIETKLEGKREQRSSYVLVFGLYIGKGRCGELVHLVSQIARVLGWEEIKAEFEWDTAMDTEMVLFVCNY